MSVRVTRTSGHALGPLLPRLRSWGRACRGNCKAVLVALGAS